MRNGGLILSFGDSQHALKHLLVLFDRAQQDAANHFASLISADDFIDRLRVFLPHLMRDEGRVSKDEVKVVVIFFRNEFGMVEIILEIVRVILCEFDVILSERRSTSKRKRGF